MGLAGFFWSASFAVGTSAGVEQSSVLGLLAVNGWHNLLHVLTGAVGVAVAGDHSRARLYALTLGIAYSLLALLGSVAASNDALAGLLAINTEDNVLHALIALGGVGAGLATAEEPPASAKAG